ncbi:TetR/AcrR family transcriptional regulator [Streptomyces niveus]
MSEPTLYKYFGDKERLLLAVLEERVPGLSRVSVCPGGPRTGKCRV